MRVDPASWYMRIASDACEVSVPGELAISRTTNTRADIRRRLRISGIRQISQRNSTDRNVHIDPVGKWARYSPGVSLDIRG